MRRDAVRRHHRDLHGRQRLGMGLEAVLMRHRLFAAQSLAWSFVLCPVLAYLLVTIIQLPAPHGVGLTRA